MTTPNLTSPEAYNAEIIANAVKFTASLFLGRGEYAPSRRPAARKSTSWRKCFRPSTPL